MRRRLIHFVEENLMRFFLLMSHVIPNFLVAPLGRLLGVCLLNLLVPAKKRAIKQLSEVFPEKSPREIRRIFQGAAANAGYAIFQQLLVNKKLIVSLYRRAKGMEEADRRFRKMYDRGQGLVMVTPHFDDWEAMIGCVAYHMDERYGYQLNLFVERMPTPYLDYLMMDLRAKVLKSNFLYIKQTRYYIDKILSEKGMLGFATDIDYRYKGLFVPFLGRKISMGRGPAYYALKHGSPLGLVLVFHDENGDFSVHTEEITVELTGDLDTDVYNMTAELASRMEWWIRKYPEQWFGWLQQPFYTTPVEDLEALLEENPRDAKALYQMGQFHIAQGETAEAEDVLKRSLETDPEFHAAHLALGRIYLEQGKLEGAEKHLSEAQELNPKDPVTLKLLGRLFLSLENYKKALEYFQKAIKRKYDDAESYWGKGRCLEKLKGHREAALNYGKGLRINYDYGPLHEAMIMLAGTSAEYEDQVEEHLLAMEKLRVQPSDELLAVLKKLGRAAPHIPE